MKRSLPVAAALLLACTPFVAPAVAQRARKSRASKAAPAATTANPKQQFQFVTVDEFVHASLPPKTAASVEGYIVVAYPAGSGMRLWLTDSVDHVLNTKDADGQSATGARAQIVSTSGHRMWAWTDKGLRRFAMYTGARHAERKLHDVVAKVRVTGWSAAGRTLNPVTRIEFQDDNGEWKTL